MHSEEKLLPASNATVAARRTMTGIVKGQPIQIGSGFSAFHFGEDMFSGNPSGLRGVRLPKTPKAV